MTTATFCKHVSRCVGQVKPPWVPMASLGEACATGDVQSIAHLLDNGASVNEFIVSGYASESRLVKGGGVVLRHTRLDPIGLLLFFPFCSANRGWRWTNTAVLRCHERSSGGCTLAAIPRRCRERRPGELCWCWSHFRPHRAQPMRLPMRLFPLCWFISERERLCVLG